MTSRNTTETSVKYTDVIKTAECSQHTSQNSTASICHGLVGKQVIYQTGCCEYAASICCERVVELLVKQKYNKLKQVENELNKITKCQQCRPFYLGFILVHRPTTIYRYSILPNINIKSIHT